MLNKVRQFNGFALSDRVALPLALMLFCWIAALDWVTSYELSLNPFYLILVGLVTWNCGWRWGLLFAFLSIVSQVLISFTAGQHAVKPLHFYVVNFNKFFSDVVVVLLLARLKILHEREKSSARVDFLTGALNNKGFYEALGVELARHRREGASFSVAYVDCDDFKAINDRFGHKMGDVLLAQAVDTMRSHLRRTDIIARLGGDEFAVVLPQTDEQTAARIIGKLRQELDLAMARREWRVTFSIGVGIFPVAPRSEDDVIAFADQIMYRVKSANKNDVAYDTFVVTEGDAAPAVESRR